MKAGLLSDIANWPLISSRINDKIKSKYINSGAENV